MARPFGRRVAIPHCTFNLELELHVNVIQASAASPLQDLTLTIDSNGEPNFDQPSGHAMGSVLSNIAIKLRDRASN